jgi:hypothetical protein
MDSEFLPDGQDYETETYGEFYLRFDGFGKEIYNRLKTELPEIFNNLTFYKAVKNNGKTIHDFQPLDSYAIYNGEFKPFLIQLEPRSGVICLTNFKTFIEIGHWSEDEYKDALDFIKQHFLN